MIACTLCSYPVKAVIISHSHADHFGGIAGVMAAEDAADVSLLIEEQLSSGKIPIIVPEGFAEHAIAENIYAGKAMNRRAHDGQHRADHPAVPEHEPVPGAGNHALQHRGAINFFSLLYQLSFLIVYISEETKGGIMMDDKKKLELSDEQLEEVTGGEDLSLSAVPIIYLKCAVDARHIWPYALDVCPVCGSTEFVRTVVPE